MTRALMGTGLAFLARRSRFIAALSMLRSKSGPAILAGRSELTLLTLHPPLTQLSYAGGNRHGAL